MLQISSYWRAGEALSVNFLPDDDLSALLIDAQEQTSAQLLKNVLTRNFPERFVSVWLTGGVWWVPRALEVLSV